MALLRHARPRLECPVDPRKRNWRGSSCFTKKPSPAGGKSILSPPFWPHANLALPCRLRGPVRVPSTPGTGPASPPVFGGRVTVMRDRRLSTAGCTPLPAHLHRPSPPSSSDEQSGTRGPRKSVSLRSTIYSQASFGAPTSLKTSGRQAARGLAWFFRLPPPSRGRKGVHHLRGPPCAAGERGASGKQ